MTAVHISPRPCWKCMHWTGPDGTWTVNTVVWIEFQQCTDTIFGVMSILRPDTRPRTITPYRGLELGFGLGIICEGQTLRDAGVGDCLRGNNVQELFRPMLCVYKNVITHEYWQFYKFYVALSKLSIVFRIFIYKNIEIRLQVLRLLYSCHWALYS